MVHPYPLKWGLCLEIKHFTSSSFILDTDVYQSILLTVLSPQTKWWCISQHFTSSSFTQDSDAYPSTLLPVLSSKTMMYITAFYLQFFHPRQWCMSQHFSNSSFILDNDAYHSFLLSVLSSSVVMHITAFYFQLFHPKWLNFFKNCWNYSFKDMEHINLYKLDKSMTVIAYNNHHDGKQYQSGTNRLKNSICISNVHSCSNSCTTNESRSNVAENVAI